MKTNINKSNKNQKSELKSRPEQSSTENHAKAERPKIDMRRRRVNRQLATDKLLALLRTNTPRFYELAEVVGKWVWITFTEKQPGEITRELAEFGFHWNNRRQSWQHPCGTIPNRRDVFDPRERYGSYFPADQKAA